MTEIQSDIDKQLDDQKQALRQRALEQRAGVDATTRAEAARDAAAHLLAILPDDPELAIAAFWPIRDEIDCRPVLTALMDGGRKVLLPEVGDEDAPLTFRLWEAGAPLYPAGFGTLAPIASAPALDPDIVIIPLLAFDDAGTRLGYGRGYYDRTIAGLDKRPLIIGYAFAAQRLDPLPRDSHDIPLDIMVTEAGALRFGAAS